MVTKVTPQFSTCTLRPCLTLLQKFLHLCIIHVCQHVLSNRPSVLYITQFIVQSLLLCKQNGEISLYFYTLSLIIDFLQSMPERHVFVHCQVSVHPKSNVSAVQ